MTVGQLPYVKKCKSQKLSEFRDKNIFKGVKISLKLQEMLKGMMNYQPCNQLTIKNIRIHPWYQTMKELSRTSSIIPPKIEENSDIMNLSFAY